MNTYYPERAAFDKIAHACKAAAWDQLVQKAIRAESDARQKKGWPLANLVQMLARSAFRFRVSLGPKGNQTPG